MQIYLTEEGVDLLEQKIADLELIDIESIKAGRTVLQYILKNAIVLPIYRSWDEVEFFEPDNESQSEKVTELKHGVIIRGEDQ